MSRTDKDRPYFVREREGEVYHDHREGVCTLDDPNVIDWRARGRHRDVCAKRVTVSNVCTKDEPHRDWLGNKACWTNTFEFARNERGEAVAVTRVWHQCTVKARERIETRPEIACECDSWLDETCYRMAPRGRGCRSDCCVSSRATSRRRRYAAKREIAQGLVEYLTADDTVATFDGRGYLLPA